MASQSTERVRQSLRESIAVKTAVLETLADEIAKAAAWLIECFGSGHKVLTLGNGGSASDAQHLAAEWAGRFKNDRAALPALALTANTSDLTAIGNDYGFDQVFARLVEAHGRAGDVALVISTSGNSPNLLEAVRVAHARGMRTIALSGKGGGKLAAMAGLALVVPSQNTARIQESHIAIGHILCELIDEALFPETASR